ncbi:MULTISPECIES: hypothetical protein [Comamonas]|uniref:hypothetical protein n=1 Tax=Comamonas TaxID=283 RepID=UPI00050E1DDD|nr:MULTISPECIES: hypothetical protein [Comamonas]KGG82716.1 hypothetical protein P369_24330 [Comamonas thiooxydans]KGG92859.1 hypothetical protein P367_23660 [Comamonas thiooxydans]KGH03310.1 hypothetical protein P368_24590 [Comamonas thiooxydans]KGH08418.1 hypothetical protein P365_02875 [Comamonas thiooxydans]TZG07408.1 hypothetical protein FZC30_19945 [Comamonas thiooxydans]
MNRAGAPATELGPTRPRTLLRAVLLGWLWLAALAGFSHLLTRLPPWGWLFAVLLLVLLPAWGHWLLLMLRKKLLRLQFAPQGHIGRWLGGGWWPACKALALALLLCTSSLWQAWFLAPWEWALLALAPLLYVLLACGMQAGLKREFSSPAFAWAWAQRAATWLLLVLWGGSWLCAMASQQDLGRGLAPGMEPEALNLALAQIHAAPSGLVRWGLDALLAVQLASGAMADLPQLPVLRLLLLALFGPVGVLLCLGRAMQGASASSALLLQARPSGAVRNAAPLPAAPLLALVAVLVLGILVQTTAALDGLARAQESPLALKRLPECERIGQQLYRLGTLDATRQQVLQLLGRAQAGQALCQSIPEMSRQLDAAVERYLDWYFSLGAEWGRILSLLTGDVSQFLQNKLSETLGATPGLEGWVQTLQKQAQTSGAALAEGQQRIEQTLARHHLALSPEQCLVRAEVASLPALELLGDARQRLTASALVGTGGGAFAAAVAGKAMAKASMKAASKVLAKAAAKQGLGKAGAAVAGAAVGSVVPGVGTTVGAVAGAVAGVVLGVGIDWAALYAEELLTRDAMRADLRAALGEQMQSLSRAMGCQ